MTENEFRNYFHELYPQLACYGAKLLGETTWTICCKWLSWSFGTDVPTSLNLLMCAHLCFVASTPKRLTC